MKIIKLDAIDSTNSFLKEMADKVTIDNFTVVVAKRQTSGRGQMSAIWKVEGGKNLTFSVFCDFLDLRICDAKYLNYSVSLSIYDTINSLGLSGLAIKWPNDIMSESKKIAGVLIENTLKGAKINSSIIGIGINVNQENFSDDLPNASSIKRILGKEIDLDFLLNKLMVNLSKRIEMLNRKEYSTLETSYLDVLYKKDVPSMFKTNQNILFMGKIIGISSIGNILIVLENETIQEFGIKEVSFANL